MSDSDEAEMARLRKKRGYENAFSKQGNGGQEDVESENVESKNVECDLDMLE